MRVLMGGSFDPVHIGHLQTAQEISALLGVDRVLLVPAACSPLKSAGTSGQHRLAMLQHALLGFPAIAVDDSELQRPPPSYTVDTLRQHRLDIGPATALVWVMGSDALAHIPRWKDWQQITTLAHVLVVQRPGHALPSHGPVANWLHQHPCPASLAALHCTPCGCIAIAELTPCPFSSSAIRLALAQGQTPAGLPPTVLAYIHQHRLYHTAGTTPTH